ncbi:hypothetical protein I580_02550 [Enterococcus caccae ATCC BAA-1240]|uniref:Uncharacterized protein n=1 Tax=Enterococcus caccae ATCC BAA-1240 TaxID=1158612 RepID=R3WU78_9ENTE|nr:hypothetical protein UC7_00040 [Enterococcus caccae ATCC BAA-1240]EOT59518.1 hypothetical protein I580_02550 [Enterococcus caccae ATCC BAA-1240]OJG27571.1 hypothetical protein RU98_GL002274 [Enterococcus caccae]
MFIFKGNTWYEFIEVAVLAAHQAKVDFLETGKFEKVDNNQIFF